MKHIALVLGLLVVGCKEEVNALVNCEAKTGPTVECAVKQSKGKAEIEVCWQFVSTCANNATLETERTCAKLKDGGARNVTIPTDKIKVTGNCEGTPDARIVEMTINGDAAKRL